MPVGAACDVHKDLVVDLDAIADAYRRSDPTRRRPLVHPLEPQHRS
jgi:hypothetical protein